MSHAKPKKEKKRPSWSSRPRAKREIDDISLSGATDSLQILVADAYRTASEKGWHSKPTSVGDKLALMHSEISEALEEFRQDGDVRKVYFRHPQSPLLPDREGAIKFLGEDRLKEWKPEGLPVELADVLIRIFDFCGRYGIDLGTAVKIKLQYNKQRSYRHGGKRL